MSVSKFRENQGVPNAGSEIASQRLLESGGDLVFLLAIATTYLPDIEPFEQPFFQSFQPQN